VKVSIFVWRLLRDRLPTKYNLVARGVISHDMQMCGNGYGEIESTRHVFRSWIGVSIAKLNCIPDHFV